MPTIRNTSAGPRGAFLKEEGAEHALIEVWANPGETIKADDFDSAWFEVVEGDADVAADIPDGKGGNDDVSDELIAAAVEELDPYNDDHWTKSGAPGVDAVAEIIGAKVSRADIERAAPGKARPAIGE